MKKRPRCPGRPSWRRLFLLFAATLPLAAIAAPESPPNIILILGDDVGAETLGIYGGESYQTPELDRLAREGVLFEHGHAQPLCTPSRVKVMTGQYNFRNYRHFGYLDPRETTFAHMLRDAGYSTTVVGKWQLYNNRFEDIQGAMPTDAGFDDYLLWQLKVEQRGSRYWGPLLNHNGELRQHQESEFAPDVFNDYVLKYIEEHKTTPFFIYYPMVLAHDPWVTTPDMRDETASDQQKFAAMMAYMDKMVGKVRRQVQEQGLAQRTLVLFIGDNGTDRDIVSRYKGVDVRGAKGKTISAGTRVPFLAWGPGLVKAGGVSASLVNLNDVLPTLADLANIDVPESYPGDGVSLLDVLTGKGELSRDNLFIHYEPRWPSGKPARYAFDRRWKLYQSGGFYDLATDPLEQKPLHSLKLAPDAAAVYESLKVRIDNMPGELASSRRWIPRVLYYVGAGAGLALVVILWLAWRLIRRRRGGQRKSERD